MRAIVTGGTGFLGRYLSGTLASSGAEVVATYFDPREPGARPAPPGVALAPLDVTDRDRVRALVEEHRPDVVYHLAGQAFVQPSILDPVGTFLTNFTGTLNLLEAVRAVRPRTDVAFAGSGTEYGRPDRLPTPEDCPLRPGSPYAASKAAADLLCLQYHASYELRTFRYRIFGTTGPGKRGDAANDFASQIASAEGDGASAIVHVGDLSRRRDISDVRDAVRAFITIVERGEPGEAYNVGSGEARQVQELLDILIGLARRPVQVVADPARRRAVDEETHLGDIHRLRALGFRAEIPFAQTLQDILADWRQQLAHPTRPDTGPPRPSVEP